MKQVILVLVLCLFCIAVKAQKKPEIINYFTPENYPLAAQAVRAKGEVVVNVRINLDGQVISATAVSGHPLLRAASEQAAFKWQFSKDFAAFQKTDIQLIFDYQFTEKTIEESERESETVTKNNHSSPFRVEIIAETLTPKLLLLPREFGEIKHEVCEVHNQLMQVEMQEILYGQITSNEDVENFYDIQEEFFPYANIKAFGGCLNNGIERKEVHFCPICRIKREEWVQKNR